MNVAVTDPVEQMEGRLLELYGEYPNVAEHYFVPGYYVRQIKIPAGRVILGHKHRNACLNLMLKGKMIVWMNGITQVVEAPFQFISEGGTRKVARVLEDMVFATVHRTDGTDIPALEQELFEESATCAAYRASRRLADEEKELTCQP